MLCKLFETIEYKGREYKRVSLQGARKKAIEGAKVFLLPCKANIYSHWVEFFESGEITSIDDFNSWVNGVMYYNCNSELGNYLHYYIEL